ncbi:hypothetical protein F503_03568 [Ophiostoma piceae UAMH 11346]|uniref:Uncharacterized protein n=1 Tax=Ophiostoma piceae (strain UAMH 11346) TaxID=1262450 RepID=S3BYE7_OPHP1|nr:hypothetical protein F503_03568 [Ophiostoma piceae UAMH 11346]
MPPSQIKGFHAARLGSPTSNATNTTRLVVNTFAQAQDGVESTTSTISSSTSGVVMPSSSQFIGVGASGAGKGVAIGVVCGIVAIFLIVMVIALTVHMSAGRGRYNRNNNNMNLGFRGADTIQLRSCRRPQQGGRQNMLPLSVNRGQATPGTTAAVGLSAHDPPRTGSWKSSLDGKLSRWTEAARSWRA